MVEHAATLINRCQKGHDGKTPERRLKGKESKQGFVEIGEQVIAKPKRSPNSRKKLSLKSRWVHATWVGMTNASQEHIVIAEGGMQAIRVRTVKRKPFDLRWDNEAIRKIRATPRILNVRTATQDKAKDEPNEVPLKVEVGGDGKELIPAEAEEAAAKVQDFKITRALLERHGYSEGCVGCDQSEAGKRVSGHSKDCRARLEGFMQKDAEGQTRLQNRDSRKGIMHDNEAVIEVAANNNSPMDEQPDMREDDDQSDQSSSSSSSDSDDSEPEEQDESARKSKRNEEEIESNKKRRLGALNMARRIGSRMPRQGIAQKILKLEKMAVILNKEEKRKRMTGNRIMDVTSIMNDLMSMEMPTPHETEEEEKERYRVLYEGMTFIDDVHTGKVLNKEAVIRARQLEIEFFRRMKVYERCLNGCRAGRKSSRRGGSTQTKVMNTSRTTGPGW